MRGIPDRWEDYTAFAHVVPRTNFLACKVPLKMHYFVNTRHQPFTPTELISLCRQRNLPLGLVIDLTFTKRYYDPEEFTSQGVQHKKIFVPGHEVPSCDIMREFTETVKKFSRTNPELIIAVHCTHGVNRTGYMISKYLVGSAGWQPEVAIRAVGEARGFPIERENYLTDIMGNEHQDFQQQHEQHQDVHQQQEQHQDVQHQQEQHQDVQHQQEQHQDVQHQQEQHQDVQHQQEQHQDVQHQQEQHHQQYQHRHHKRSGRRFAPYDTSRDRHADRHADRYRDRHTDRHVDRYRDRYADRHVDRHSDRHADRHSDRHADRHADRHIDRHSDRHSDRHVDRRKWRRESEDSSKRWYERQETDWYSQQECSACQCQQYQLYRYQHQQQYNGKNKSNSNSNNSSRFNGRTAGDGPSEYFEKMANSNTHIAGSD